jgi:hypothetical protein
MLADLLSTGHNPVMDNTLLCVVLVVAGAVSIAVAAWVISWHRNASWSNWPDNGFQLKRGLNRVRLKERMRVAKSFCRHLHSPIRFLKAIIPDASPSEQIFPRHSLSQ